MSKTYFVRIEPRTTSGDLEAGLAARVYDPLWLLGRQWQVGELLGEDGGSPVGVELAAETATVDHFLQPDQTELDYDPAALPLDVLAGDPVPRDPGWTARLRIDAGRALLRALADAGVSVYGEAYRTTYPIDPADEATRQADPAGARLLAVASGRIPDGEQLYAELSPAVRGGGLPTAPPIAAQDVAEVRAAAEAWLDWCDELLVDRGTASWVDDQLTHRFGVAHGTGAGATVLDADGFRGEVLDWHSFDARPTQQHSGFKSLGTVQTLPTGVRFRGMPNARWWEFEDASVDLGSVDAGPSDVARLALLEFGLVYANNFFAVPLQLPVGSLCRITSLEVSDTFGMRLQIGPAAHGASRRGAGRWSMFTLAEHDPGKPTAGVSDLFFLPPVANQIITSEPVEDVLMLRDEMANLAWAVERRYEGETGAAVERLEEMTRSMPEPRVPGQDASLVYTLGTTVPPYWFPLVPEAQTPGDVRLRLEQMAYRDASFQPRGRFLALGSPSIPDADVPREGTRLLRDYALTRWTNGATFLWARRIRRIGRGEGSSGLRFDVAELHEQ